MSDKAQPAGLKVSGEGGGSHYGDFQNEIYGAGLRGIVPSLPVAAHILEERAMAAMPPQVLSYVQGGCGDELTQRRNVEAFGHWGFVPRMMVDCTRRDMSIELFGLKLPSPIFLSPIGVIGLCERNGRGDIATARAAQMTKVPMVASTLSNDPLEAVAEAIGDGHGFFQLYAPSDKGVAESLVHRAEKAGFKGLVITLDTWVAGWRPRDLAASNFPQLRGHALANYFSDPNFGSLLQKKPEEDPVAAIMRFASIFGKNLTWSDLPWLRSLTKLPLILKGICHPDDARRAIDGGVDAVYCSNHGGRQANNGIAAIDMLPAVVDASGKTPVLFDSGVRTGTDVVKALALGAAAVGIGRPYAYGMALGGAEGVVHVLRTILAEADLLMAIDGFPTIADLRQAGLSRM
jgi:lactate 2-monooxygenase